MTVPQFNRIYLGKCEEVAKEWPDNWVDAVVTDPPYGLGKEPDARKLLQDWLDHGYHHVKGSGFMGNEWDAFVPQPAQWAQIYRVMKPGAFLLAFAGTRTYDWMVLSLRLAGFEIRDQVAWLYGQGMPKSRNVSMDLDRVNGLGPSRERALRFTAWMRGAGLTARQINDATASNMGSHYLTEKEQPVVATSDMFDKLRPLLPVVPEEIEELVRWKTIEAANFAKRTVVGKKMALDTKVVRPGVPGRDADGAPLRGNKEIELTVAHSEQGKKWEGWGTALKPANEPIVLARKPLDGTIADNILKWGVGALNVEAARVDFQGEADEAATKEKNRHADFGSGAHENAVYGAFNDRAAGGNYDPTGRWPANVLLDQYAAGVMDGKTADASRFFYVAKPDRGERNDGLAGEQKKALNWSSGTKNPGSFQSPNTKRESENFHPTVKPIDLMAYLVQLITPKGGVVLDPFLGSGTTAIAAARLGHSWVGVERDAEYLPIAEKRVAAETAQGRLL